MMMLKTLGKWFFLLVFLIQAPACQWGEITPTYNDTKDSSGDDTGDGTGNDAGDDADDANNTDDEANNSADKTNDSSNNTSDSSTNTTAATRKFTSIAPGGAGAFTVVAVNPNNTDMLFAGTNVGGVIRTVDGGKTYQNVTNGIGTNYISDIKFATIDSVLYVLVATPMGLYVSDNSKGDATLGDTWELEVSGLQDGYGAVTDFYHPLMSIEVDPNDNKTVWVGIGFADTSYTVTVPTFSTGEKRCDPYQAYKYSLTSKTFTPTLSLRSSIIGKTRDEIKTICADIESESPSTIGQAVSAIKVHPKDSNTVLFATDLGLYETTDGGVTVKEIGLSGSCTSALTSPCLPVQTSMGQSHPLVTGVDIVSYDDKTRFYAVILDTGFISPSSDGSTLCSTTATGVTDSSFTTFRGGPWYSDDLGETWTYFYQAKDNTSSTIGNSIRCSSAADESNATKTTWYAQIKVNPTDRDHIFLNSPTMGGNSTSGMWEHRIFSGSNYEWKNITYSGPTGSCYVGAGEASLNYTYDNCWEGNRSDDLFRDGKSIYSGMPGFFDVTDWSDTSKRHVYFESSRGITKATWKEKSEWSDGVARYSLDHLHTDPVDPNTTGGVMEYWSSSELNDFCPSGGLAFLDETGTKLVLGGKDASLLLSKDSGATWKLVRDNENYKSDWALPKDFNFDDMDVELIYDDTNKILYAAQYNKATRSESNSILKSTDGGEIWSVIGGYCTSGSADNCDADTSTTEAADNGLPNEEEIMSTALDYTRDSDRRLLAGTKTRGLYIYDPEKTFGSQWSQMTGTSCPYADGSSTTVNVGDIWTDTSRPKMILAAFNSSTNTEDGIYQINIDGNSCTKLVGPSETSSALKNPQRITLSKYNDEYRLVASGDLHSYPVINTTVVTFSDTNTIDTSGITWSLALDFYYTYSSPSSVATAWEDYLSDYSSWKAEYEHEYFKKKDFTVLKTVPGSPEIILATLAVKQMLDYNLSGHIYISKDGGQSWAVSDDFEDLPVKSMTHIQFSPDSKKIYFSTQCSSLFVECSPFMEDNSCSL